MPYKDPQKQKVAEKNWRDNNRDIVKKRREATKSKNKQFLRDHKEANPCTDCGNYFPHYVMEFDHRDSSKKIINVTSLISTRVKMMVELDKCDVVCANCHSIRTWLRKQS